MVGAKGVSLIVAGLLLAALFVSFPAAEAAPEPALVPRSWEFEFSYDEPRPIAVKNLRGEIEWYWYITYKVINNSGQERLFIPEFTIASNLGDIVIAGKGVRTSVFDAIKKRVGNRLLESPTDVVGRILQGDDNAKEGAIIWPAFKHNVDQLSIFVAGLSGETVVIKVPDPADATQTVEKLLSKTLQLDYSWPGYPLKAENQSIEFKGKKWIMR